MLWAMQCALIQSFTVLCIRKYDVSDLIMLHLL